MSIGKKHIVKRRDRVDLFRCRVKSDGRRGRVKLQLLPHTPSKKHSSVSPRKGSSSNRRVRIQLGSAFDPFEDGEFVPFNIGDAQHHGSKTTHEYMSEWVPKERLYLYEILDMEGLKTPTKCCTCQEEPGDRIWRCNECLGSPVYCTSCCKLEHRKQPFHRVQLWTGTHFQSSWLWKTGLQLSLCASGSCVPLDTSSADTSATWNDGTSNETTGNWADNDDFSFGAKPSARSIGGAKVVCVVHLNGVHYLPFNFCRCLDSPSDELQLLRHGFMPSSFKEIRTAFTHALLDDYLLQTLECFTSTHHYYSKLKRMTNKNFPHIVPDRTRELRRAGRQWRRLKELKEFGFGHTRKTPGKGEMALFCAACPQPGVNLPEDWKRDPEDWKYQRSLVADGNFVCVHRKQKNQGESDVYLKNGEGFMTERTRYRKHLRSTEEKIEPQTCHEHRAIADKSKVHKGCDVTGIGAFACMRHGCFAPGSVVDFQKGERQVNMDYGLCQALETTHAEELSKVLLVYDVNCQYSKRLLERIENGDYLDLDEAISIVFAIGLFHVHGHQESCFARYALTFIRGAGMAAGEILESLWSVINEAASTTSMMTLAGREEALDAVIADSNWKKLLNLVPWICKNWASSRVEAAIAQEDFELLNETASTEQQRLWESQLEAAHREREHNPASMDILNIKIKKPPTKAKIQHDLMTAEQASNVGLGVTSWLASGIKLQDTQDNLRAFIAALPRPSLRTEQQLLEVAKKREAVQAEINAFYETALVLFPTVDFYDMESETPPDQTIEIDGDDEGNQEETTRNPFSLSESEAEDAEIPLPSSFAELPDILGDAAAKELKLRIAQADDALESIRVEIGHKSYLYRSNIRLARGKQQRLRGYAAVKNVDRQLRLQIKAYTRARWALGRLGADDETMQKYRELRREDTRALTAVYEPNARGQRNTALSWIWTLDVEGDSTKSEYLEELYRVNWLRAKSRADRWREEHSLLTSEMDWVLNFFSFKEDECKAWATLTRELPGHRAYALRQAEIWRMMGSRAEMEFKTTKKSHWPAMSNVYYAPFLSQVNLVQKFTASELQSLVDYVSSRARASGIAWSKRASKLPYEKRKAFGLQLYYDLEMAMLLYAAASLRFAGIIRQPTAVTAMFKIALNQTLILNPQALTDLEADRLIADPVLPSYKHDWWNSDVPYSVSMEQLVAAWRDQRVEYESMKTDTRGIPDVRDLVKASVDDNLQRAARSTQQTIDALEEDLAMALSGVSAITAAISRTESTYQELMGQSSNTA